MKKKVWWLALAAGLVIFSAVLFWLFREAEQPDKKLPVRIAVVVYGKGNSQWRSLDQGIAQACGELNIERPLVSVAAMGDAGRQANLLRRGLEDGVDGLLVAAVDDIAVPEFLAGLETTVPVVMVESGGGDFPYVGADDVNMARMLAEECMNRYQEIAIVYEGRARASVRARQDAFIDRMRALGREPILFTRPEDGMDLNSYLAATLASHEADIDCLVALDTETLESAMDALPAAMVDVSLCGIGTSNLVVDALDTGVVDMLVFPNEYAVGYLGVYRLAQELGLAEEINAPEIEYRLVTRENMYLPDIERLIFPINQ